MSSIASSPIPQRGQAETPNKTQPWVQGGKVGLMMNVQKAELSAVLRILPALQNPTISSLSDEKWVAVRAMVPRKEVNRIMDELAETGAKAVLASDIRSCRL